MIWQDLMLDRWVDEAVLRQTVASALGVPVDAVAVTDTPEQLAAISPSDTWAVMDTSEQLTIKTSPAPRVIVERVRQHRDLPLQLLVALRDDALIKKHDGFEGVLQVVHVLAERLNATVLFAEGPLAPSEWVRVRPTGQVDVVSLDLDDTGEVDSYFVIGERPLAQGQAESTSKARRMTA